MDPADYVAKYPTLLHLADVRSWPSIERHGVLSATEIVGRWLVPPDRAEALLTGKRTEPLLLDHPELGVAVPRDQHPLREHLLAPALTDGMNVGDWLRLLNGFALLHQLRDLRARVQEVAVMDEVSDLRYHLLSAELRPADDGAAPSAAARCAGEVPPQVRGGDRRGSP